MVEAYRQEEKLLGIELVNGVLKIRVQSGGCTKSDHFRLETYEAGLQAGQPYRVVLYRTEPDNCGEIVPEGLLLEFKFEDMITEEGTFPKPGDGIIVENIFTVGSI